MRKVRLVISAIMLSALFLISSPGTYAAEYVFSGGPSGGAFQNYANAVAALAREHGIEMTARPSGGSVENVRLVGTGQVGFSVAHSGNVLKGRKGQLEQDADKYSEVLVIAHFYGARAQLVVRADSDIVRPSDLRGKKVGVGNAGSGAAASCELFYRQLGIWEDMNRSFIGYRAAAEALVNNRLDAFWVLAGFPNAAVLEAARQTDVRLPDLYSDGEAVGFFTKYPNFSKVVIPAGSYRDRTNPSPPSKTRRYGLSTRKYRTRWSTSCWKSSSVRKGSDTWWMRTSRPKR